MKSEIESFYRKTYKYHLNKIAKILYKDKDYAHDIVQDAFIRALNISDQYDPERGSLSTWFNYILYSTLRNFQRTYKNKPEFVSYEDNYLSDPIEFVDFSLVNRIDEIKLKEEHKEVVFMFYVLGYNSTEISRITGFSVTNITTICGRFKKKVLVNE